MTDSRAAHPGTYLGDGVYASFDGEYIVLRTARTGKPDDKIFLDAGVYRALKEFARDQAGWRK